MPVISSSYGKTLSYEEHQKRSPKTHWSDWSIGEFEKFYIKLFFILYNIGSYWTVTNFKYTEDITDLFLISMPKANLLPGFTE